MVDTSALGPERSDFLNNRLNPVLHDLVTEIIVSQPAEPLDFMVEWLEKKNGGKSDFQVDEKKLKTIVQSDKIKDLENENNLLKEELLRLKNKLTEKNEHLKMGGGKAAEDEDEDEEDDEDLPDELPPAMVKKAGGPRSSVSAEAYGEWNVKTEFKPPVYPKTDEQTARVQEVLNKSFLFNACDDDA